MPRSKTRFLPGRERPGSPARLRGSYYSYPENGLILPPNESFQITLSVDEDYRFRDECFARFFLYGRFKAIEIS